MEALRIPATESSPAITLDPEKGTYEIIGESRPEDVRKFYEPILEWLDKYKSSLYWLKDN
ncbi:MAG: SiaC family regulatory phosphoprotein [Flavobacteriales bacterium]|nr:SiaC family regulatory phosphoprotein [Flavobacteriales bacterium]